MIKVGGILFLFGLLCDHMGDQFANITLLVALAELIIQHSGLVETPAMHTILLTIIIAVYSNFSKLVSKLNSIRGLLEPHCNK